MSGTTADRDARSTVRTAVDAYVAVGVASALLGGGYLVRELASESLGRAVAAGAYYGLDGLATWVALHLLTFGAVGVGGTYLYLRATDRDVSASVPADARVLLGPVAVAGTVAAALVVAGSVAGVGASAFVERFARTAAVRGVANPAPGTVVGAVVLATKVAVVAPAFGVVVHGVLQTTLAETVGRVGSVAAAASLVVVAQTPLTPTSVRNTPFVELLVVAVVLLLVAAVAGEAYDRTGNLAVPAFGYAAFVAAMAVAGTPLF